MQSQPDVCPSWSITKTCMLQMCSSLEGLLGRQRREHLRVPDRHILQVDAGDPLAAALYDVLRAVGELHVPMLVDARHVPRAEPAVVGHVVAAVMLQAGQKPSRDRVQKDGGPCQGWGAFSGLPLRMPSRSALEACCNEDSDTSRPVTPPQGG